MNTQGHFPVNSLFRFLVKILESIEIPGNPPKIERIWMTKMKKFPIFSLLNREIERDRFAGDSYLHHEYVVVSRQVTTMKPRPGKPRVFRAFAVIRHGWVVRGDALIRDSLGPIADYLCRLVSQYHLDESCSPLILDSSGIHCLERFAQSGRNFQV